MNAFLDLLTNLPIAGGRWSYSSNLEIDVTSVLRQQVAGDGKLSILIIGIPRPADGYAGNVTVPVYGSREDPSSLVGTVLQVYNNPLKPEADASFLGDTNQDNPFSIGWSSFHINLKWAVTKPGPPLVATLVKFVFGV